MGSRLVKFVGGHLDGRMIKVDDRQNYYQAWPQIFPEAVLSDAETEPQEETLEIVVYRRESVFDPHGKEVEP